jgi:hypothetical protein
MPDEILTNSTVAQTGNTIGGDNAGGNISKPTYNISAGPGATNSTSAIIERLTHRYRHEKENNVVFRETVERLEHYQTQVVDGLPLTLEEKLKNGGRKDLIGFAKRTKEMFAKKLARHSLYESAQEVHACLLAEVYCRFHEFVYPHVSGAANIVAVNALIRLHIVDPLLAALGENAFNFYSDDIYGMLYFLTGTCHIKWTK